MWMRFCHEGMSQHPQHEKTISMVTRNLNFGRPRLVGDIIKEMSLGNSPLAKSYRKFVADKEKSAEKGGEA